MRFFSTLLVATLAAVGSASPWRGGFGRGRHHGGGPGEVERPDSELPVPTFGSTEVAGSRYKKIPNQYIVVLRNNVTTEEFDEIEGWTNEVHRRHLAKRGDLEGRSRRGIKYRWRGGRKRRGFKGYAGEFDDDAIAELRTHPEIKFIEQASTVSIQAASQKGAPWGIARVSKFYNDLVGTGGAKYVFDESAGKGTTVYVIDTGINANHEEFEGRAIFGGTTINGKVTMADEHGHGTHVAGTIAGKTYGIAKKANIVAYKVLGANGEGTNQDVLEAIDLALDHAEDNNVAFPIINMSLGGAYSDAVNERIMTATKERSALFIVAAGNGEPDAKDVAGFSPGSAPEAITVGATDFTDTRASFSHFGPLVDIMAPGVSILSATIGPNNNESKMMRGTSMAAPHVAGVAAYFAGMGYNRDQVRDLLLNKAHTGKVKDTKGGANRLLFNGGGNKV